MKKKTRKLPYLFFAALLFLAVAIPVCASHLGSGVACLANAEPMIKSGLSGEPITFSPADFRQALGLSHVGTITVTEVPDPKTGTLKLAGFRVKAGDDVDEASLSSLTFTAATPLISESSFRFRASAGSGAEMTCRIRLLDRGNAAPSVESIPESRLSITAQSGTHYAGTLVSVDPEGDDLSYLLVTAPSHGSLLLNDPASGRYTYTPQAGYTGSDEFRYVARDGYGNYSTIASVSVTVKARAGSFVFDDMTGSDREGDALTAAAAGIMQGTISGDKLLFDPTGKIKRGEFVVMAMKAAGIKPRAGLTETFFDDNESIPTDLRGYIATAQRMGLIVGTFGESGLLFDGDELIPANEAARLICRIVGAGVGDAVPVFAPVGVLTKSGDAASTLYGLGILDGGDVGAFSSGDSLTREDAAALLSGVIAYLG